MLICLYIVYCAITAQLSNCNRDCNGPQTLKYLLSGPLQITCDYPGLTYSRDCPYLLKSHPCSAQVLPLSEGCLWSAYPCLCSQQVRGIHESTALRNSPPPVIVDKYPSSLVPSLGIFYTNYPSPSWVSSLVAHSANCFDKSPFTDFPLHIVFPGISSQISDQPIFVAEYASGENPN